MFKKPTLFIVGAGGSCELNLPAGDKLKKTISSKLDFDTSEFNGNIVRGDPLIGETLRYLEREDGRNDAGAKPNYLAKARFISQALPHGPSIDNFLHFHSSDPEIVRAGKIAIAATILEEEGKSHIRFQSGTDRADISSAVDTWHNKFCSMAIEGHTRENLDKIFENTRIITFNYDRCIEHYVAHHIETYVGVERRDAWAIAKTLKVIHVYGQPGPLPWSTGRNDGIAFGNRMTPQSLVMAADKIKTFTEGVHEDSGQQAITDLMNWADRLVFMGFSYGDINMEILMKGIEPRQRTVIAGMKGISTENREVHRRRLANGFGGAGSRAATITMPDSNAFNLLSDHEALLKS